MKKFFSLLVTAVLLFSCNKSEDMAGTFNGPDAAISAGKGRTWIKLDAGGAPLQLAISIDDAALNSMPTTGDDTETILQLTSNAKSATPFDHIAINWNPHGHAPAGIYDKPHFDLHFYMVSEAEVMDATDPEKLVASVPAGYLPENYIPGPAVPMMGMHNLDATSPELNGQPFTQTFIYGSYDGEVTYYEPMTTLDFLKTTSSFERTIPQPLKYKKAGYYPTKMSVEKHDGLTDIVLGGFVQRQAT